MARKCPSCNHFCPVEQGDAELNLDVGEGENDKQGEISGEVRLVLTSGCCGDEIAETVVYIDDASAKGKITFDHPITSANGKHEVVIEAEDSEPCDRYDGKPGTPARYQRHYYGADVTLTVACKCGWKEELQFTVEESASGFDDLT